MPRTLFLLPLLLLALSASAAQAEDSASALPPPTEIQDSPEALETVEPQAASREAGLSGEFAAPEDDANVEVYSSTRKDGTKIEEYSHHGRVYMVKVSPPGGLPSYYLYDNDGDGKFERRLPGGYKRIIPPEWVIKRF